MPSPYIHRVPAITAGTPQTRIFENAYPQARNPFIRELAVYNRNGSGTITLCVNGDCQDKIIVAPGDYVPRSRENEVIRFYSVEVDAGTTSGADVDVYEYGGIHDDG